MYLKCRVFLWCCWEAGPACGRGGGPYSRIFPGDTSALDFSPSTSVASTVFCSSSCCTWSSKWGQCQPRVLGPTRLEVESQ